MAHGGSLTINPQTGLPEAGFLKNILPTVLGFALTPFMGPLAAGLTVGGIETVRTGDIGKGFLAGLGAYGGAQIGGTLGGASAASAAPSAAAPSAAGAGASATAGTAGAGSTGLQFADAASPEFLASQGAGVAPTAVAPSTLGTTVNPVTFGDTGAAIYGGAPSPAMEAANLAVDPMAVAGDSSRIATTGSQVATAARPTYGQMGQGFKDLFTQEGAFDKFIGEAATKGDAAKGVAATPATGLGGGIGALQTAGMAAAPALMATPEYDYSVPKEEESDYEGPYTPSERQVSYPMDDERRRRTSEFMYFSPSNPVPFAEGGEADATPDVVVSPNEARAYKDIINVQRLAGLPALDPSRFAVMPGRSYERFVYNPIETDTSSGGLGPEMDYEFAALGDGSKAVDGMRFFRPTSAATKNPILGLMRRVGGKKEDVEPFTPKGRVDMANFYYDPELGGYVQKSPAYAFGKGGFASGGRVSAPMLENGGFVLTKKAVDGLGKGSNKKGQKVASRGLGAIPIKGPGTGTSDSIKTSIEGKRPALVSNGEAYVPKKQVAKRGGAKAFYALMAKAEKQAKKAKRA
jgi:hypothetical protein